MTQLRKSEKLYSDAFYTGLSAALAGVLSEIIFYGVDSYKVLSQAGGKIRFSRLFQGAVPVAILGSGPCFGVFFLCYNPLKIVVSDISGPGNESLAVLVASAVSGVPSSIVGVPADVIKKHILLGANTTSGNLQSKAVSVSSTTFHLYRTGGMRRFFLGWQANLIKDVPFCGIKMSLYEGMARLYIRLRPVTGNKKASLLSSTEVVPASSMIGVADSLSQVEAAGVGFASGMVTSLLTCPIDNVNTRIKSGELAQFGIMRAHVEIVRRDGFTALFRGLVPRSAILGFGSTIFWFLQSSLLRLFQGKQ